MDAVTDPSVTTVTVIKSARVGYTKVLDSVVGYFIAQDPSPILVVQPRVEDAEDYSRTEIAPMLRDTPVLADIAGDLKAKDSSQRVAKRVFRNGSSVSFVGANSPGGFRRITARIVLFDEVDGFPVGGAGDEGDQIALGTKRSETFWNRKIVLGSTPTIKDQSRIEKSFRASDMRRFFVPCPQCGARQALKWSNLRWDKADDGVGIPETAHFVCEESGCIIEEHHKPAMIDAGEWVAEKPFEGHAGFHIWAAYSLFPNAAWRFIVEEFLRVRNDPPLLQTFVNLVLGETWEEAGSTIDAGGFSSRLEAYDDQTLPESVRVVTAGVDVQDDRLEVQFIAWGRGEESWPCRYEILRGDPAQAEVWSDLDRVLLERFATVDGRHLMVRSACIDTGGHHAASVYSFCRTRRMRRIFPTKGQSGPRQIWPKRSSRGGVKGAEQVYVVGVDTAKDSIYGRLRIAKPGAGFVHFPNADGFEQGYFDQLTAEKVVTRYRHGRPLRVWELKKKGARNEALDTFVYALAALKALPLRLDRVPQFRADEPEDADMAYPPDETTVEPTANEAPQPATPFSFAAPVEPERRADAPRPRSQSRPARRVSRSSYFG